jgi:hypothetical protein
MFTRREFLRRSATLALGAFALRAVSPAPAIHASASTPHPLAPHADERIFNPQKLVTGLGLNQMEFAPVDPARADMPLALPGAISRSVVNHAWFDPNGRLSHIPESFYGKMEQVRALGANGVRQILVLEVTEQTKAGWIENAITDLNNFFKPAILVIGNELNLDIFQYANKTLYYQQLAIAFQKQKALNASVGVYPYGPSPTENRVGELPDQVLENLLTFFERHPYSTQRMYPFDGVNYHGYLPDQVFAIRDLKTILAKHQLAAPFMVGESGLHVSDVQPRQWDSHLTTPADQANYLWQSSALAFACGAEMVVYFTCMDFNFDSDVQWGLYRLDGSPRPAVDAFRFAQRIFNNVTRVAYDVRNEIARVTLQRADGVRIAIVWNTAAEPKLFRDFTPDASVYDHTGKPLTAAGSIPLTGRRTKYVAGDVIIVVEMDLANGAK